MALKPLKDIGKKESDFINAASADGKKNQNNQRTKRTTIRMSGDDHKKIKMFCVEKGIDMNDLFLDAALEKIGHKDNMTV